MENTIYILVGQRIKDIRKDKRLTQEELARKLDFSAASISNIEKGTQSIYLSDLYKLSEELNVDIQQLLPTIDEVKAVAPSIDRELKGLPEKEKKIVESLRKLIKKEE